MWDIDNSVEVKLEEVKNLNEWDNITRDSDIEVSEIQSEVEDKKNKVSILLDFENTHYFETYLREGLDSNLIWQQEAKDIVIESMVSSILSIRPKKWPLAVLFFTWPTGVWKTEMVKALSKLIFWNSNIFVKISCENYQESHTTRDLFWAPKSYIWYWDSTPLDSKNIYKGYDYAKKNNTLHELIKQIDWFNIILFDEIEKAHSNVHQWLLSLLDDARIEFSNGKVGSYKNSIIIFTSNLWQKELSQILGSNPVWFASRSEIQKEKEKDQVVQREMKKIFSPEFLWRLDTIVQFKSLSDAECNEIIDLHLSLINNTLSKYYTSADLSFSVDKTIYDYIKKNWYSDEKWARELVRILEKKIESKLNILLRSKEFSKYLSFNIPIEIRCSLWVNWKIQFHLLHDEINENSLNNKELQKYLPEAKKLSRNTLSLPKKPILKYLNEIFSKISLYVEMYHINLEWDIDFLTELRETELELRSYGLTTDDIILLRNRAYIEEIESLNFIDTFEWIKIIDWTKKWLFFPLDNRTLFKIINKKLEEYNNKYWLEEEFVMRALSKIMEIVLKLLKKDELSWEQQKKLIVYVKRVITEKYWY